MNQLNRGKHDFATKPFMASIEAERKKERRQPSKAAKQRVRDAFDAEALIDICQRPQEDFVEFATRFLWEQDRFYYYQDNGSDILAVAHLDHVQTDGRATVTETAAGLLVCSGALDDRLGAYVILDMLPKLGINVNVLLTTGEEMGRSTASEFFPEDHHLEPKQFSWMIEFDRGGTDVVSYQYETPELCELVAESGARMDTGSYSDIACLDHLGCAGLNWGVGYQDYHSARSHAWLEDTFRMVARFEKFWKANKDTFLPYEDRWNSALTWDAESWVEADCGHDIDLEDPLTFVDHGAWILCYKCDTEGVA